MLLATSLVTTKKWHSWMAKLSQDATARLPPPCQWELQWELHLLWKYRQHIQREVLRTQAGSEKRSPARNNFVQQVLGSEEEIPRAKLPRSSGPLSTDAIHWKLECQFVMFAWQKRRDYYYSMKDQSPSRQRILCFWTEEVRSIPNVDIDANLHLDTVTTFMQK